MKAEKIRNLTDVELQHQERDLADQLFKLKFQMNMGQTESLKKVRGLRRDIARVQTVRREQELAGQKNGTKPETPAKTESKVKTETKAKTVAKAKIKAKAKTAKTKTEKK
jgi:large subunit ribosomal protein L29